MINLILTALLINSAVFLLFKNSNLGCGLVGFSGAEGSIFNLDKIKLLLMLNQERGKDSFGYYTKEEGVVKDTGKVEDFMVKSDFNIEPSNQLIAHVRSSSVGGNFKKNAHPFKFDNVVLAMNGTLTNHWSLCSEYKLKLMDYDVDSEVLAKIISIDKNYNPLTKILGSCALLFTNTETDTLYCYRNIERPLFGGYIGKDLYISSIENSLKIIGCSEVKTFEENFLYEIYQGKIVKRYKVERAIEFKKQLEIGTISNFDKGFMDIDFYTINVSNLVGKWLQPKSTISLDSNSGFVIKDKYYKVVPTIGFNQYLITIIDENNNTITIPKHNFIPKIKIETPGDYVFAVADLYYNKHNRHFCDKDDLLIITHVTVDDVVVKRLSDNSSCKISKDLVRPASEVEKEEYILDNYKTIQDLKALDKKNEESNSKEEELEQELNYDVIDEKDIENLPNEDRSFEYEVLNTDLVSWEDLVDFTLSQINDIVDDISTSKDINEIDLKIENIKFLLINYENRYNTLVEEESLT